MASPFAGLFTGNKGTQAPPAAPSSAKGAFTGLFTAPTPAPATAGPTVAPKQPVAAASPVPPASGALPVISPQTTPNAFKGSLGNGYGAAVDKDQYSGKPLMTFENQNTRSSDLLNNRVAPTFDPTIPQKIDPTVLHNNRMPEAASEAVRKATGAEPDEQLDHLISLELGGSNDTSNLNLEKLKADGTQPSLDLENQTAKQVASGAISYIDGQKIIARAKGVKLPDDQNFSSSQHPLAQGYPNPAPNQTGTQSQQKPNIFQGLLTGKTTSGQPTVLAKSGNFVKNAFITNPGATSDKLFNELGGNAIVHPVQTLNTIVDNAKQGANATISNLAHSAAQVVSDFTPSTNRPVSDKASSVLNLLTSAASTLFFPVSETFDIASQLPVIKPAADATGLVFNDAGKVGGFAADKLLSALPISTSAKSNLASAVHNVGTLAGQIILGGHIYGAVTGLMDAKGDITPEQEQKIVADANDKAQQLNKASMPETPAAPEQTAAHVEATPAIVPEAQSESRSSLPAWAPPEAKALEQETSVKPSNGPAPLPDAVSARPGETSATPSKSMPAGALRPIEGVGDTKTRGLSSGVLDKAIANTPSRLPEFAPDEAKVLEQKQVATKLADTFGDLPQYKQMDVADQGARAIELFQKDPETARQIAYGAKAPPKGLTPEAVFIAVEQDAIERGDGQTLRELANSRLTSEATTMGQRLRMLAERNPESPTEAIRSVQAAREKAVEAKNSGKNVNVVRDKVTDDVTKSIARETAKPRDWSSFISSIQC